MEYLQAQLLYRTCLYKFENAFRNAIWVLFYSLYALHHKIIFYICCSHHYSIMVFNHFVTVISNVASFKCVVVFHNRGVAKFQFEIPLHFCGSSHTTTIQESCPISSPVFPERNPRKHTYSQSQGQSTLRILVQISS